MSNSNYALSVVPTALLRLSDVFNGTDTRYTQYRNKESKLIEMINKNQTAMFNDVMSGGRCKGVDVTFLKNCTAAKGYVCEVASTEYPACDVPVGASSTSDKVFYDPKCLMHLAGSVNDDLCDNEFTAVELFTRELARLINDMDIRLNQYSYNQIAAKTQVNNDPMVTDFGTVNGTRVDIPSSNFTSDLLVQLEINASYNGLDNYMIFDARNLLFQKNNSLYRSLNQDERNQAAQFNAWDTRLVFDNPYDVQTVLARNSTFFVDMDMLAFVNRTSYTSQTPTLIDSTKGIYTFTVTSPRTGMRYDVDYQKLCSGRDVMTNHRFTHALDVKFIGGLVFAPIQCDSGTGILEYTRI